MHILDFPPELMDIIVDDLKNQCRKLQSSPSDPQPSETPQAAPWFALKTVSLVCRPWRELMARRLFRRLKVPLIITNGVPLETQYTKEPASVSPGQLIAFLRRSPVIASGVHTLILTNAAHPRSSSSRRRANPQGIYGILQCLPALCTLKLVDITFVSHISTVPSPINLECLHLGFHPSGSRESRPQYLTNVLGIFGEIGELHLEYARLPDGETVEDVIPSSHLRVRSLLVDVHVDHPFHTLSAVFATLQSNAKVIKSIDVAHIGGFRDIEALATMLKVFTPDLEHLRCSMRYEELTSDDDMPLPSRILSHLEILPLPRLESMTLHFDLSNWRVHEDHDQFFNAARLVRLLGRSQPHAYAPSLRTVTLELPGFYHFEFDFDEVPELMRKLEEELLVHSSLEEVIVVRDATSDAEDLEQRELLDVIFSRLVHRGLLKYKEAKLSHPNHTW